MYKHLHVFVQYKSIFKSKHESQYTIENQNTIKLKQNKNSVGSQKVVSSQFKVSKIFDAKTSQKDIFSIMVYPLLKETIRKKRSGLIMAYGETGSGKTHTMLGSSKLISKMGRKRNSAKSFRIYIYKKIYYSFVEIYNEQIIDLLNKNNENGSAKDEQKQKKNMKTSFDILKAEKLDFIFESFMQGSYKRKTLSTNQNNMSSRSHCIFSLYIKDQNNDKNINSSYQIHMVDLAGSEKIYKFENEKNTIKESKNINLSLLNLQQVFLSLEKKSKNIQQFVPYRQSVLTWFLKDCLTQNSVVNILITLNFHKQHLQESLNSLKFGLKCQNIKIQYSTEQQQKNTNQQNNVDNEQIQSLRKQLDIYKKLYEESLNIINRQKSPNLSMKSFTDSVVDKDLIKQSIKKAKQFLNDEIELEFEDINEAFIICQCLKSIYKKDNVRILNSIEEVNQKLRNFENLEEEIQKFNATFQQIEDEEKDQNQIDDENYQEEEIQDKEELDVLSDTYKEDHIVTNKKKIQLPKKNLQGYFLGSQQLKNQ